MYINIFCFITFSLIYYLSVILYTWATPVWFKYIPEASGFRFILGIEIYCLCCIVFFVLRFSRLLLAHSDEFIRLFFLSFMPVPVFAGLFSHYLCRFGVLITQGSRSKPY